jgi:hypothetical protein
MNKQTAAGIRDAQVRTESEGLRKAVIRYTDGSLLRGYISPEEVELIQQNHPESFPVKRVGGQTIQVQSAAIKAIFFVKTFEGSKRYSEFKVFTNQPNGSGVWVRVQFLDGEVMEGVATNSLETYTKPVFQLTPPDPASNNQAVLVSKHFLQEMQILGLAAD